MVLPLFELAENRIKIGRSKNRGIVFIRIVGIIHKIYLFAKFFYYLIQGNIKKHFDYRKRCVRFSKNDILFRVQEMSKILGVEVNVKYINEYLFIIDKK